MSEELQQEQETENTTEVSGKKRSFDKKRDFKGKDRERKEKDEQDSSYIEKLISVRRVTKVVKGGKNMSFSALVVVGDGKGKVAYSNAKAREVPDAVKKASTKARSKMTKIPLKFGRTLHHDIGMRQSASRVFLRTAKSGTGVIAGGPMRAMFEALGLKDVVAKSVGTNNQYNVVRSTFSALKYTESPRDVAERRGLTIADLNDRKKALLSKNS